MGQKTTLVLVRHGQTQWNEEHRLQGHKNSPLTDLGKQQAILVRKALKNKQIHCAYVSPLGRAQETMDIILGDRAIQPIEEQCLKEINLGPWEGKTKKETQCSHPNEYQWFWHQPELFQLKGAETYAELQNRIVKVTLDILKYDEGKTVLLVSHWIAIKVLLAYFTNVSLNNLTSLTDINNGEFMTLIKSDGIIRVC